ncbi:septation protein SepH [Aeromicrobium sp.]|uniref:septation protein SepH n=1 Tax=Aeromicrobium sp. TaxID=1871063 RepID=UPI003D6AC0B5
MRELGLDGLSEDGRFLIARDHSTDETFHIPADRRLSTLIDATSRDEASRKSTPGPLETRMESSLSPRDIQTRIRRGESPDEVAVVAGVPVDRIIGFATPVLAEREYMCEQARKTTIRRKHVGGNGALLGVLVDENVAAGGSSPEEAHWDSWRREDGRWTVVVAPSGADQPATFLFDVKSRYVLPTDEYAHDLVGDVALPDSGDMAIADALRGQAQEAAPSVEAAADEVPTDDVTDAPEEVAERDHHAAVSSIKEARERRVMEQLALSDETEDEQAEQGELEIADLDIPLEHDVAVPDTLPRKKKHERRRVPSWDEIMFGGRED